MLATMHKTRACVLNTLSSFGSIHATLCTSPTCAVVEHAQSIDDLSYLHLTTSLGCLDGVIHDSMRNQQMQEVESTRLQVGCAYLPTTSLTNAPEN